MRFRKWMQLYREQRYNAVPAVREALADARKEVAPVRISAFRPWQRIAALAASVAIVIGIGGYFGFTYLKPSIPTLPPDTTETSNTSATSGTTGTTSKTGQKTTSTQQGPHVMDGPSTGILAVSINRYLPASLIGVVDKYATAHTVRLRSDQLNNEHKDCLGVYYDTKSQKIVCPRHTLEQKLPKKGITTKPFIHAFHPSYNTAVFTLTDGDKSSYFYDVDTDTLKKLSVSLYQCFGNAEVQSGTPYVVFWRGGGNNDIYAMQMETGELINILKDKNGNYLGTPMDDARLSACGKYAIYTLGEGSDPNGPGRTTVFYTFATKELRKFTGEVCEELIDQGAFLLNTPKGYVKYNIATGTTTSISDMPKQYHKYLKKCDVGFTPECYRLMLCDRVTGTETLLCEEFVYAHSFSPNRRYLCYYIRGEKHVRVRDLQTGADSVILFDVPPTEQTEGEELKNRALLYSIAFEGENELILLYAANGNHRLDPNEVRAYKEQFPDYWLNKLREEQEITSIQTLADLMRKFPENLVAYEGDGFIYLDYSALYRDDSPGSSINNQLVLEDYENGIAYTISHQLHTLESDFQGWKKGTLPKDAEKATRTLLEELGIPIEKALRDYRPYLSDDAEAVMQIRLRDISAAALTSSLDNYCIDARYGNEGNSGWKMYLESPAEKAEFLEFLKFTDTLKYRAETSMYTYTAHYTHIIRVNYDNHNKSFEIYAIKYNGKYFLTKDDYIAEITAEQYTAWEPWLTAKSKLGYID